MHDEWAHVVIDWRFLPFGNGTQRLAKGVGRVALCSELTEHLQHTGQSQGLRGNRHMESVRTLLHAHHARAATPRRCAEVKDEIDSRLDAVMGKAGEHLFDVAHVPQPACESSKHVFDLF